MFALPGFSTKPPLPLCCCRPAARVHPGETNSSWMMKGALQHLLADTEEAAHLRETFVFKASINMQTWLQMRMHTELCACVHCQ